MNASPTDNTWPHERNELRRALRARRRDWWASPEARLAEDRLGEQLLDLLRQLEPLSLGLYWPLEGEFNAADWARAHKLDASLQLALPFARKGGDSGGAAHMRFHRWDGQTPTVKDECGIPTATGPVLVPEVLLVPCLGFTREGYRLGYGGGYFDRWLEAHPGVTTIGLAWACTELPFEVQPHDQPMTIVLTEKEVIAP
ncbi:5-formyltetrahydrofolate cyclo-ligase [Roseateles sp. SL47]|jgi:5-formyltetrahydrofolate cyclo-ligase|uniref:5-formyltetrahydrofolate cyclo-ligase n=1 Tax=Roseateles sp. SL47 TaxID=2995138 RepID=UPI0022714B1C|nr:5-formyltetrahydrofolate cyclo-ligase [Roseateles sp. SL47]WAC73567.1 5-formyltetrahydrofolate cyclo-ligase [Roseateles sp. SL47]